MQYMNPTRRNIRQRIFNQTRAQNTYRVPQFLSNRQKRRLVRNPAALQSQLYQLQHRTATWGPATNRVGLGPLNVNRNVNGRRANRNVNRNIVLRRAPRMRGMNRAQGRDFVVNQRESYGEFANGMTQFKFEPGNTSMPMLDALANLFDNYIVHSVRFEIVSALSTNVNGRFHSGVDYQPRGMIGLAELRGLSGYKSDSAYAPQEQVIDPNRAMKQKLHATAGHNTSASGVPSEACTLFVYSDADQTIPIHGEVFVDYTICFKSPNPPANAGRDRSINSAQTSSTYVAGLISHPQIQPGNSIAINDTGDRKVTILHSNANVSNTDLDATADVAQFDGLKQADKLTIATVPNSANVNADSYKINFSYSDGTPVEFGTIVPLMAPSSEGVNVVGFHQLDQTRVGSVIDLLATVFQIAKPFLKDLPIIGTVLKIVGAVADNADDDVVGLSTSAFAFGEELTINLPDTSVNILRDFGMNRYIMVATTDYHSTNAHCLGYVSDPDAANVLTISASYKDVSVVQHTHVDQTATPVDPDVGQGGKFRFTISAPIGNIAPIQEGDVFSVSFVTYNENSGADVIYDFEPSPLQTIGFYLVNEGNSDYYVATKINEGQNRVLAFDDTINAWPVQATDVLTYGTFVLNLTRVGCTQRASFEVPLQEGLFSVDSLPTDRPRIVPTLH